MELATLEGALPEIRAAMAGLVAISPQLPEHSRKIGEQKRLTLDVLSDPGKRVAREIGLVFMLPEDLRQLDQKFGADLQRFKGDDSWTMPMPARYIIGRDATIRSADVNPDYTIRPDPSLTVELLRGMPGKK